MELTKKQRMLFDEFCAIDEGDIRARTAFVIKHENEMGFLWEVMYAAFPYDELKAEMEKLGRA